MSDRMDRLGCSRVEEIAEFLLKHMNTETRRKMMAEMPQHYALLYPTTDEALIIAAVQRRIGYLRKPNVTSPATRHAINQMRKDRGLAELDDEHFDAMDRIEQ